MNSTANGLKTLKLLGVRNGEWEQTLFPVGELTPEVEASTNWAEQKTFIVSNDNWMTYQGDKWGRIEVEVPEWMDAAFYCRNNIKLKYVWGFGLPKFADRETTVFVMGLSSAASLAVIKLLNTKSFRSEFRASLRNQLVEWLATPAEQRRFDSPFSRKQWDALVDGYVAREADQISDRLYYAR